MESSFLKKTVIREEAVLLFSVRVTILMPAPQSFTVLVKTAQAALSTFIQGYSENLGFTFRRFTILYRYIIICRTVFQSLLFIIAMNFSMLSGHVFRMNVMALKSFTTNLRQFTIFSAHYLPVRLRMSSIWRQ